MKKRIALFLTVITTVSMLTGCGANTQETTQETVEAAGQTQETTSEKVEVSEQTTQQTDLQINKISFAN